MEAARPYLKVTYNGADISKDISDSLVAFTYTDNLEEADTIDLQMEDFGLLWQNEWYPEKGAIIKCEFGIRGGVVVPAGEFEFDEIELLGPPDQVNVRGIAAGFSKGQKRTQKSHTHEGKTLSQIVHTVASSAGLKVVGSIGNIRINRKVQHKEKDFTFLRKLAHEYGYVFNIKGDQLIFMQRKVLEDAEPLFTIDKTDLINFSIRDKSTNTYKGAIIKYQNPLNFDTVEHLEEYQSAINSDDILVLTGTAENKAQAIEMTKSALQRANKLQQFGNITIPGHSAAIAGNVFQLTGIGNLSGNYIIKQSNHLVAIDASWTVECEIYKVGFIEDVAKRKPKKFKEGYSGPEGKGDKSLFGYY